MCLPGPIGNPFGSEQNRGDRTIGAALGLRIKCAQRKRQALSALVREFMKCGASGAPLERPPETPRCMGADLEIAVERQFGGLGLPGLRLLFQPKPMLGPFDAQEDVPAVGRLPEFAREQLSRSKHIPSEAGCALNNRNYRRQNFRCPEYRLLLRGPCRVSSESRGPISS
jgi:hypothetical protein